MTRTQDQTGVSQTAVRTKNLNFEQTKSAAMTGNPRNCTQNNQEAELKTKDRLM